MAILIGPLSPTPYPFLPPFWMTANDVPHVSPVLDAERLLVTSD